MFDELTPTTRPELAVSGGQLVIGASRFLLEAAAYRVALVHVGDWEGLGQGLAGGEGVPVLDAAGAFVGSSTIELVVSGAEGSAPGAHVLGLSTVELPLFGGTLVPEPLVLLGFVTDSNGGTFASVATPLAVPPGLELFAQSWILDAGGVLGWSATNAVGTSAP